MFHAIDHIRVHIYPRSHIFDNRKSGNLRGSNIIFGMLLVMLAIIGVAHVLTLMASAL